MKRMVRLLPLLASTFLLAGILSAAGPVEPDEAGDGTRMYRGQWRNLAKEAAAMRMRAGNAKDEVERFHAFHQLAFLESDRQQWVPMRAAAEIATAIGDAWFAGDMRPPDISYRQRIFHLECRGLVEKGLVIEGRLAEARAELQRMRLDLIKLHVAEHGGTAESVAALTELDLWKRHSLFMLWQIIGSEAFHLEREGRTNEAVQVLRTAVDAARNSRTGDEIDGFYEIQLAPELAGRLFDLGYVAQGIAVLEEFVREWDGDKDHFAEQYWGARIQLPMFRAELEGPSEALVREAEDAHQRRAAAFGGGRDHWGEEVLAGMRHRLKKSPETEAALRQLSAKMNSHGEGLESLSVRTEALAIGNESPQPGRDQEFIDLLMDHRRVGDKSREPGLYKSYGDYLLKTGRPAEALAVYREALRQVVSFDWRVQEPRYRLDVIVALTRLGDWPPRIPLWRSSIAPSPPFPTFHPSAPWR